MQDSRPRVVGSNPQPIWPKFFSEFSLIVKASGSSNFQSRIFPVKFSHFRKFPWLGERREKVSKPRDRSCPRQTVIPPPRRRSPIPRCYLESRWTGLRGCHPLRPSLAGPNANTQASDDFSDQSTDTAAPATNSTGRVFQFQYEYPSCERSFTTTSGRGLHHRRAHKAWYDERVIQQATQLGQRRWTREETALLARREAELTIQGVRFINQALHESFPKRLVSSISNCRCSKDYRDMVQQAIHEQRIYV